MIVPGSWSQALAAALTPILDERLAVPEFTQFPDGETLAAVPAAADGPDRAVVVAATPSNDAYVELLQLQDALQEAGVDEIVTVTDSEIAVAVTYALERAKTLTEGAGAVPLAALLTGAFDYDEEEVIVPVLSGGNIDVNTLTTVLLRGLVETGRYLKIRTVLPDRPGALVELADVIAGAGANIYAVSHDRTSRDVAMDDAEIELDLETRGPDHVEALLGALDAEGYEAEVLA
jgi:hypothetical protein